ncbi:hypothetical protein LEP1GSC133_3032 [Leptospira borgpetersenii serovar Pomona str. 200901868]|uniref:Uncharacterized protein n=1 Tax=Leptospira borgpetersenii serovar Pomona str. 200901868 TaxID=1192866 RepID=M6WHC4_LEPBO|nr:hypothetical protein LEP1GSC133_3032 [Leptospira borgpetersenii serovar Pomona str. 200901868]
MGTPLKELSQIIFPEIELMGFRAVFSLFNFYRSSYILSKNSDI